MGQTHVQSIIGGINSVPAYHFPAMFKSWTEKTRLIEFSDLTIDLVTVINNHPVRQARSGSYILGKVVPYLQT